MSDAYIRPRLYLKPWVAEQCLDMDLPAGAGRTWLYSKSFATEAEAAEYVATMMADAHVSESWRARNRSTTLAPQRELFAD